MSQFVKIALSLLAACSALISVQAFANGGPVDLSTGTPSGILRPVEQNRVKLLGEDLKLKLLADGKSYSARALYTVEAAEPLTQGYMVPLDWGMSFGEVSTIDQLVENGLDRAVIAKIEKSVVIAVASGGRTVTYGCKLDGKVQQKPALTYSYGEEVLEMPVSYSWCVTTLKLGAGVSTIELSYRGEMEFMDEETSKSSMTSYMPRTLRYDFSPAGYWAQSPAAVLNIELDITEYPGRLLSAQAPFNHPVRSGGKLAWSLPAGDLRDLSSLVVGFTVEKVWTFRDLMKRPASKAKDLRARVTAPASAPNQPTSYLFDGRADTSWCASRAVDVIGQIIRLDVDILKTRYDFGRFEGVYFINGVSKSAAHYVNNHRIQEIEVRECGREKLHKVEFDTDEADFRYGSKFIPLPWDEDDAAELPGDRACLEIKILKIKPGTSKNADTCIGEIVPILNHG